MDELHEATQLLDELVCLESPSGDRALLQKLATRTSELLGEVGCECAVGPDGSIVGQVAGTMDSPMLVLGHLDTVWPQGRLETAPFAVRDGVATGPGVFDMKAGLVALYLALRRLARAGGKRSRPIRVVLTADEEIGSPSGASLVRQQMDGVAAVLALEPPLDDGSLKVGRRGVGRALIRVHGREAHAGLDAASGVSAVDELIDQLRELHTQLQGSDRYSINIGTISGGSRANVVAGAAHAELGLRFADVAAERYVFTALESLRPLRSGASVDCQVLSYRPAWEPGGSSTLRDHVCAIAAHLGERLEARVSPGAGDANLTGSAGYPTVDGLGPTGRGAHAAHEAVDLASIPRRAKLLAELLTRPLPLLPDFAGHSARERA